MPICIDLLQWVNQSSMYRIKPGNTFAWITTHARKNFCKGLQTYARFFKGQVSGQFGEAYIGPLDAIFSFVRSSGVFPGRRRRKPSLDALASLELGPMRDSVADSYIQFLKVF